MRLRLRRGGCASLRLRSRIVFGDGFGVAKARGGSVVVDSLKIILDVILSSILKEIMVCGMLFFW